MCNVKVKDRVPSKELRERLGIEDIILTSHNCRVMAWVMLHMGVKVHSPTPPPRAVAVRDVSLSQLAPRRHLHQFANCHCTCQAAAVRYHTWVNWYLLTLRTLCLWDGDPDIASRLFNGLTANDCWHRIYRSQQRSPSLGKGLMLAETVAQTDGQSLPIFIYRYHSKTGCDGMGMCYKKKTLIGWRNVWNMRWRAPNQEVGKS